MSDRPNLIIHSASPSSNVWTLKENLDYARRIEMDGMVMNGASSWNLMKPGVVISLEDTRNQMAGLEEFNRERHNYFLTQTDDPGDVFDDAAWAQVVENFRTVALAAKDAGYKGLIFDNEEYNGQWQNYPEHYENADPSNLEAYQAQAALRGKQVMEAINEVFPDAEVGVMHGPYMSVSDPDQPGAIVRQGGGADRHELRGPFFTGLAEGRGPDQKLIDMGELYELRTESEFAESQNYRSDVIPDLFDWDVPAALRANWDAEIVQSHMLITTEYPVGAVMAPDIMETTLLNAYKQSEDVVFIFSNPGEEDWFTEGALDPAWLLAVENATAQADRYFAADQDYPEPTTPAPSAVTQQTLGEGLELMGTDREDSLTASNSDDVMYGRGSNDTIASGRGDDMLIGGSGNDRMYGGAGDDTLMGGQHADFLYGGGGQDRLFGETGDDNIWGRWGDDVIFAGSGEDWIRGGDGQDTIYAGLGADVVWGNAGADVFAFLRTDDGAEIRDFEDGLDRISLPGQSFDDLQIVQDGELTELIFDGGAIQLAGISASEISVADFVF